MYRREVLEAACGFAAGSLGGSGGHDATAHSTPTAGRFETADASGAPDEPRSFTPLGSLPVEGAREAVVGPDGTTVYLAVVDGFAVADVTDPRGPHLVAERRGLLSDADGGPVAQIHEVAVDGDRLLVVGPAHIEEDAAKAAMLFDVSDPADPRRLAVHRTEYPIHNGALRDGLAYLTANDGEGNPLEIVAMAGENAADGTRVLGRWSIVDEDDAWADVPAPIRPLHDVAVHDGVAYCSYWDAGTWLVDVSDPTAPSPLGRVGERSAAELASVTEAGEESRELPGNHHSTAVDGSGSLLAVGREAWDADDDGVGGPGGIDLVDVSSPGSPEVLASIEPPATPDPTRGGVWTTAHNFELRDGRLYSAWYQGGVRVHDVSDPGDPREIAAWRDSETTRFWTAQVGAETVVASSMGVGEGEPGLYTFPRPANPRPANPRLTNEPEPSPPVTGTTDTATPVGTATSASREVTATPGMAGFGVVATGLGGLLAWVLARRRG